MTLHLHSVIFFHSCYTVFYGQKVPTEGQEGNIGTGILKDFSNLNGSKSVCQPKISDKAKITQIDPLIRSTITIKIGNNL